MLKVSIITTCFNREGTIRGAIESVLVQDYPNIEYIVIDGASKDGSMAVINDYKDKITKIISEPDHGMYEAINKGIRLATGDIIGLVHSDDFLYDSLVISDIVKRFKETNADFLYGDGIYVDVDNINKPVRNWIGGPYRRWKVGLGWLPLHPTCYIRRSIMLQEGLYDESYKIAADSDLLFRYLFLTKLKVTYFKRRIIKMRMGGLSTNKEKRMLMWDEDVRMYKSHGRAGVTSKVLKILWKVPQYVEAKFIKIKT